MDSCWILVIVLVVMLLVALIGHGIWLLLAAIIRAITGSTSQTYTQPPPNLGDDAITAKKLQQLYREGKIDLPTFQSVLGALNSQRIIHPPIIPLANRPTPPPPPPPPPPAPAEFNTLVEIPIPEESTPPLSAVSPQIYAPPPPPRHVLPIEPFRPPSPPPPPRAPRKPFSEIFKHFMEESNIRWGELVGGLLIIGCSIALVLTFWEQIATQPWLRFFLFTAVTSAIFVGSPGTELEFAL